jgi:hypothetical protein
VSGSITAILLAVPAAHIFQGASLTPLSQPLPFYGFPFLAATLLAWAWVCGRRPVAVQSCPSLWSAMPMPGDQPFEPPRLVSHKRRRW